MELLTLFVDDLYEPLLYVIGVCSYCGGLWASLSALTKLLNWVRYSAGQEPLNIGWLVFAAAFMFNLGTVAWSGAESAFGAEGGYTRAVTLATDAGATGVDAAVKAQEKAVFDAMLKAFFRVFAVIGWYAVAKSIHTTSKLGEARSDASGWDAVKQFCAGVCCLQLPLVVMAVQTTAKWDLLAVSG
jgi:hypothetical protein